MNLPRIKNDLELYNVVHQLYSTVADIKTYSLRGCTEGDLSEILRIHEVYRGVVSAACGPTRGSN